MHFSFIVDVTSIVSLPGHLSGALGRMYTLRFTEGQDEGTVDLLMKHCLILNVSCSGSLKCSFCFSATREII